MMATHIKISNFEGIRAFGKEFKLSQLADDTRIFINSRTEVSTVLNCVDKFSEVSG